MSPPRLFHLSISLPLCLPGPLFTCDSRLQTVMASLAGLTLLTTGSNASNTLVDIVFVHGLGEHPVKTWTTSRAHSGRGVCWPVEFLQKDLPSARLLTFGWSPKGDVRRDKAALRAFIRDENAINGPAEELVIGLERWRRAESQVRSHFRLTGERAMKWPLSSRHRANPHSTHSNRSRGQSSLSRTALVASLSSVPSSGLTSTVAMLPFERSLTRPEDFCS